MKFTTFRRPLALALVLVLASISLPPSVVGAEGEGTLTGFVLDPSGNPAVEFRLVFRPVDGGVEFTSPPSNDLGRYRVALPAGKEYLLVAAIAPDGTRLEVPDLPPIPVEEGVRRVDVGFQARPASAAEEAGSVKKSGGGIGNVRWWQVGGIVGAVLVFSAVVLDDDEDFASPSVP